MEKQLESKLMRYSANASNFRMFFRILQYKPINEYVQPRFKYYNWKLPKNLRLRTRVRSERPFNSIAVLVRWNRCDIKYEIISHWHRRLLHNCCLERNRYLLEAEHRQIHHFKDFRTLGAKLRPDCLWVHPTKLKHV